MNWTTAATSTSGESSGVLYDGGEKASSGRRECGLFMGMTGRLDKSSCEWAGYQCVCELGAELLPTYSRSMLSSRQMRDRDADRLRRYVVTLFSMALGLPLLLDKRVFHIGQWIVGRGRESASADEADPLSPDKVYSVLVVHVAWACIFIGWTPFVWQAAGGTWDAARLGGWINYTPIGPLGGVMMLATAPLQHFRPASMLLGMSFLMIGVAILSYPPHISSSRVERNSDPTDAWGERTNDWLQSHNLENNLSPAWSLDTPALHIILSCIWFAGAGPCTSHRPCTRYLRARARACACAGPDPDACKARAMPVD